MEKVIIIEPDKNRRELAIQLGTDFVFSPIDENLFQCHSSYTLTQEN